MRRLALFWFGLLLASSASAGPEVPAVLDWCGMRLHLQPEVRAAVQAQVNKLTANANVQLAMAERAATYFPFATDALRHIGVPEDLKFMMIQESGVRPDVVSTSLAVGFWQLKDYTATEMGVTVSAAVDERKHITAASIAAARYFTRANGLYRNWLYAVIAYYEGPTGALPHTDPALYGAREMTVTSLHWYAVKALAHKVAYEALVRRSPRERLRALDTGGETSVWALAKRAGLSADALRSWNRWIGTSPLPAGRSFSYFVPSADTGHAPDPTLALYARPVPSSFVTRHEAPAPAPPDRTTVRPAPPTEQLRQLPQPTPALLPLSAEPWFGDQFTYAEQGEDLAAVARRVGLGVKKLARCNALRPDAALERGALVLLREPTKVKAHIVTPGQTLTAIAARYRLAPERLSQLNRLSTTEPLPVGRKLWLRTEAPIDVPRYDLAPYWPELRPTPASKPVAADTARPAPDTLRTRVDQELFSKPEVPPAPEPKAETAPATITVQKGETLYGIARRHGLSATELRRLNGLSSDTLRVGQVLRVR